MILGAGKWEPLRAAGLLFVAAGAVSLALREFDPLPGGSAVQAAVGNPLAGGIAVVAGLLLLATTARRD